MDKPIVLVEQELKEELVNLINKYNEQLPISIVITMLADCTNSLVQIRNQQLAKAVEEYKESEDKKNV